MLLSTSTVPGTGDAWAGGEACTSAACPQAFLLDWQGSAWSQVVLPHFKGSTAIISVSAATSATDAWAVGRICLLLSGSCKVLLLHWNGTMWSAVAATKPGGVYPYLYSVTDLSRTDAWAVGGTEFGALALHWNGKSWINVPVPAVGANEALNQVAAIPGTSEIWVLGGASGGSFMLLWNGSAWSSVPLPHRSSGALSSYVLSAVAASSSTNAWTVGSSFTNSGTTETLTLQRRGTKWSAVPSPDPSPTNDLYGATTTSQTNAWVVGAASRPFQTYESGLALHWNGSTWAKLKLPVPKVPAAATPRAGGLVQPR